MSVITNKDRITENNDRINRLIELAKQKDLTSNPKQATTEDEMTAMITDKNVGKVVKYLGESGGKYEKDALYIIAEGDGTDSGLLARRLNITEGSLSITENGIFDVSNMESVDVNVTGSGGSDSNKLALVVGTQSADNLYDITTTDLEGVTVLGDYAFYKMNGLKSMELPETCTSIGNYAFYSCSSLTSVDMLNVASIGEYAFSKCSALTSADIPDVTSIGNYTFSECSALPSVSMSNATSIGVRAFHYCFALTSADIPNVTSIGNYAFQGCKSLTSVDMPNVTSIGNGVFYGSTFYKCTALTSLTIPSTCTSIGSQALQCGSSTNKCTFTFEGTTPPTIESNTFNASYINKIIVPVGCGETYKTATNWTNFADYIEEATE